MPATEPTADQRNETREVGQTVDEVSALTRQLGAAVDRWRGDFTGLQLTQLERLCAVVLLQHLATRARDADQVLGLAAILAGGPVDRRILSETDATRLLAELLAERDSADIQTAVGRLAPSEFDALLCDLVRVEGISGADSVVTSLARATAADLEDGWDDD